MICAFGKGQANWVWSFLAGSVAISCGEPWVPAGRSAEGRMGPVPGYGQAQQW